MQARSRGEPCQKWGANDGSFLPLASLRFMEGIRMAEHAISRASHGAIDLATVHLSGVRHLFATVRPQRGSSFTEQAEDALQALDAAFAQQTRSGRWSGKRSSWPSPARSAPAEKS